MNDLILAGACSIFDLKGIKSAFEKLGFNLSFVDAPFMAGIKIHNFPETEEILYTAELPEGIPVIPLSEFWISYCIKHKSSFISEPALKSSRSKAFLYDFMKTHNFDYPEIYNNVSDAVTALEKGKRIVVKPVGLHSGYGIEILDVEGKEKLEKYLFQAQNIKNRTLRIMEIENQGAMLTEAVEGTEYSADGFWHHGRFSVVRICRKRIVIINDKPCALSYTLLRPESEDFIRYSKYLEDWTSALFSKDDISFAQYDFIVSPEGRVVPVDFASRIGGGISDLLMETGINPYALAVEGKAYSIDSDYSQYHYLSVVSGYIKNDNYPELCMEGKLRKLKKSGDYVISNPSSVGSRIALFLCRNEKAGIEEEISKLLLGEEFIEVKK